MKPLKEGPDSGPEKSSLPTETQPRALLIFARYPRLGTVKTRLSSRLSADQCLDLYQAFLLDTLNLTARLGVQRFLFLADCSQDEINRLRRTDPAFAGIRLSTQKGPDLGARMWNAFESLWPDYSQTVFLGADTPHLPIQLLEQAFSCLNQVPFVVGPVDDGGYYLLGLAQRRRRLFFDIPWGTPEVLRQTLGRLPEGSYRLLPEFYDIDTPADLRRLVDEPALQSQARRTRQALRSLYSPSRSDS